VAAYRHIVERGPLFADYYLRPGGTYYRLWLLGCLLALTFLAGLVALPQLAWGMAALAGLCLVASSAWLAENRRDFWRVLVVLPVVASLCGLGILKGKSARWLRQLRPLPCRNWAVWLVFAVVGLGLYSHILHAPFVYDDVSFRDSAAVQVQTFPALMRALVQGPGDRWLGYWTFAVNFYLGGLDPFGYHLTNVLVHIANGWLVFWLIATTLTLPRHSPGAPGLIDAATARQMAFFAALLWLVHPVQTQAVTYVVQRLASLSALLCLVSFACYVVGRQRAGHRQYVYYGLSVLAWLLALGVKQNAAVLPLLVGVYDLYFFHDAPWRALRQRWLWLVVLGVCGVGLALYVGPHLCASLLKRYARRDFTLAERLLTESRVVLYYLSLLVFPHPSRLRVDYDFPISSSLLHPASTLLATAAIVMSLVYALAAAARQRLLSFAILWFLGHLVIESSIIPLDLVYEHRLYLPSLGPLAALTVWGFQCLSRRRAWLAPTVCSLVALTLAVWTYQRNEVWRHPVRLWTDNVYKAPGKARVHGNLGKALLDAGRHDEAVAAFQRALALDPRLLRAYSNLAVIYIEHFKQYDQARAYLHAALAVNPKYPEAHLNLGVIALNQGDLATAIAAFTRVLQRVPSHLLAHYNLAACYMNQGDIPRALAVLDHGLAYWPAAPRLYLLKGRAYQLLNNLPEARKALARAYALQPHDPEVQRYYEQVKD
jgi:tetratricopeptide (TPR) repeat protein